MKIIKQSDKNALNLALNQLKNQGIFAFKTDTIYGFGVDATCEKSVENLYKLKKREKNKPIAIFVEDLQMAQEFLQFDDFSMKFAAKFFPNGLTLILPKKSKINLAKNLNEGDNFLGFRIVSLDFITQILREFKRPIAVTSANISGENSTILPSEVVAQFENEEYNDFLLIDDGICEGKIASTVVKITNQKIEILREGAISKAEIEEFKK